MNKIAVISAVVAIVLLLVIAVATALNGSQMGNMEGGSDLGMMGMHNQMMGNAGMMEMHNQMGNNSEMHKQCGKMMGIE